MSSRLNFATICITAFSAFVYYTTFYTDLYLNQSFSPWYFPGAALFTTSIIATGIGIMKSTKWLNVILLTLNVYFLLHFSALWLLV